MLAPYHQPQSLFCARLPPDIILDVALELADTDPLGPPRHLPPLFRTCAYIHDVLTARRTALFARIYQRRFDTRAARRRLGPAAINNTTLTFQLMKQSLALKRIRSADLDNYHLTADLWSAYIMFLENDGRNYSHLLEYAHIDVLLDRYMESRLWSHRESNQAWPVDCTPNSLVIWMLWFTMSPERLAGLTDDRRGRYIDLLRPFALVPVLYYPFHAPDMRFDLPDEDSLPEPGEEMTPFGLFPTYPDPDMVVEQVWYHCRQITIMPPLIGLGAKMVFIMLAEAVPYEPPSILAVDRAHANPADGIRPTQADFIEWAAVRGVKFYSPGTWDWAGALTPEQRRLEDGASWRRELRSVSASFDNDWNRLTGCYDPRSDLPLKGVVYTFGSMDGMFAGRMQIPDLFRYRDVVQASRMPELTEFPIVAEQPVFVRFREHHCIDPETPVPTAPAADGVLDDVQNAYLPHPFDYRHVGNTLRIDIPGTRTAAKYETFAEGRPNSHNPRTCRACLAAQAEEERALRARIEAYHARLRAGDDGSGHATGDDPMDEDESENENEDEDAGNAHVRGARSRRGSTSSDGSDVSYFFGDEDDPLYTRQLRLERDREAEAIVRELMAEDRPGAEYDEFIDDDCNGIQDIIITGEVLPRHGEAWHHYRFYGRVRKWDGLVVLVRVPTQLPWHLKAIFRGYVVGNKTFVGSWRSYHENLNAVPLEGPFALSRVEEAPAAPRAPAPAPPAPHPAAVVSPESAAGQA